MKRWRSQILLRFQEVMYDKFGLSELTFSTFEFSAFPDLLRDRDNKRVEVGIRYVKHLFFGK